MSDYKDVRKEIKQVRRAAETADDIQQALTEFFALHNELRDCDSNRAVAIQYFNGDELTLETLEESYAGHPKFKEMLCTQTEEQLRAGLEDKIVELLRNGTSPDNIRAAQMMFRFKSIAQLKAQLQELDRRAEFRTKTPDELREIIRRPKPGHPELPPLYRNRDMILTLPKEKLAHFILKYGSEAINKVLNQREK